MPAAVLAYLVQLRGRAVRNRRPLGMHAVLSRILRGNRQKCSGAHMQR